jgi:hypothetical protein
VQALKPPPSSWHWKLEPVSVEVKLKLALVALVGLAGFAVIVVSGGVLSMTTVRFAESRELPALSKTRARTWYVPSAGWLDQVTE